MGKLLVKLGVSAGTVVLAAGALEWGARSQLADRPLGFEHVWEEQEQNQLVEEYLYVGKFQFREAPPGPESNRPGTTRVLFLGDSFTFGSGVAKRADRFTDLVEAQCNASLVQERSVRRVDVFNAGINGGKPSFWWEHYQVLKDTYRPDQVFAVFFLRDGTLLPTSMMHNQELMQPILEDWQSKPLYRHSRFLSWLYDRMAQQEFSKKFQSMLRHSYLGTEEEQQEWRLQRDFLAQLADQCRQQGRPFHLVIFPLLLNLEDYQFHDVEQEIQRFAKEQDIPVLSLTPGFLGQDARKLWVSEVDQHPNEQGHLLAAKVLTPYLLKAIASSNSPHAEGSD